MVALMISAVVQHAWPDYAECVLDIFSLESCCHTLSLTNTGATSIVAQGSAAMYRACTESTRAVSASKLLLPEFLGSSARRCNMLQGGQEANRPTLGSQEFHASLALKNKTKVVNATVKRRFHVTLHSLPWQVHFPLKTARIT